MASESTTFPVRAAAIDAGSNAIRLLVGEFTGPEHYMTLAEQRVSVRLGGTVFGPGGGELRADLVAAGVQALRQFRQRMDELRVGIYRASATSAVREATNGGELIRRAWTEAGIRLEAITGGEEARLVWLAVRHRLQLRPGQWLFMDLGGGSVEIGHADGDVVLWSESHAMGAVRLLNEIGPATRSPADFRKLAGEYIDTLVSHVALQDADAAGLIATGGNIEELARLAGARMDDGVIRLRVADLARTIDRLAALTPQQRMASFGLRPDRADVVLPAALVYERIAHLAGMAEIIVPFVGLKEGLLLDTVQDAVQHEAHADRQQRDIMFGAIALGRRYQFDEAHARHVAMLAVSLFDQLHEWLDLEAADRRILLAAALLHDIGQYISNRRHHKHSRYLISHASLPDLTPHETELVALVARYHRRAEPSPEHEGYRELAASEQSRVTRLAALLRLADALDRQHRQHVRSVRARPAGERLHLDVTAEGDLMLEEWAVEKKAQLITRLSGTRLDVTIRADEPDAT